MVRDLKIFLASTMLFLGKVLKNLSGQLLLFRGIGHEGISSQLQHVRVLN